jgi:uncharacterized protein YdiU (UPF0061 family)
MLFKPLLDLMEELGLDFHASFRHLCFFRSSMAPDQLDRFVDGLLECAPDAKERYASKAEKRQQAVDQVKAYLEKYSTRISNELDKWNNNEDERQATMLGVNPRFVLRQWVLESVIAAVEKEPHKGRRILAKVLHVSSSQNHIVRHTN